VAPAPPPAPSELAAVPPDADRSPSGLAWRVLHAGHGDRHPSATSRVLVEYTGWTSDGRKFDSSRDRGRPVALPLEHLIAGWREGLPLMVVGEERRFWIPADLAYGKSPHAGRPAGMLVYDVELLAIDPPRTPPSSDRFQGAPP